jgi:putative transposase
MRLFDDDDDYAAFQACLVNQPQTEAELDALRRCVPRSQPYGSDQWVNRMAVKLGLECTLRPRGRPKKE